MYGMMGYHSPRCPNCGAKGWKDKTDCECEKCGFKKVETKEYPPICLTYCDGCGCTLSDKCDKHPAEKQRPVKL